MIERRDTYFNLKQGRSLYSDYPSLCLLASLPDVNYPTSMTIQQCHVAIESEHSPRSVLGRCDKVVVTVHLHSKFDTVTKTEPAR